jgi:phosphoglycolate phosphatase-like HAD superfamily hydrolase
MIRLALFDIDGTLLQTGGIGRASTRVALKRVYGTYGNLSEFYPGGRTIEAILFDTMTNAQIRPEYIFAGRRLFYAEYLAAFTSKLKNGHSIEACHGGLELVSALSRASNVVLGLVTGNHHKTAALKLITAGYDFKCFEVGAYGHESADRAELVNLARNRAIKQVGRNIKSRDIVVIGDTARDIESAKGAGVRSIAVATGTDEIDMLREAQPDYIFENFLNTQEVLDAILE